MKPTMTPSTPILSPKRYLMLFLFCIYSGSNSFQWIEYAIISNIISEYYSVSIMAVNWTSVIYMALYIPGIIPASWLLDKFGLRVSIILGCFGTTLGSWIKVFSVSRDAFWVTMAGQTIVATAQLFILNIPPRLAAVWFGENEVSKATALGVTCNNLGIAIGFLIPPFVVPHPKSALLDADLGSEDADKIAKDIIGASFNDSLVPTIRTVSGEAAQLVDDVPIPDQMLEVAFGLNILFISLALITLLIFVAILIFFDDKPPHPPSMAQAATLEMESSSGRPPFSDSMKSLFGNKNFVLLLFSYGLNVAVFYAISTVLNQLISLSFPGHEKDAGLMGLIMTLSGIFGSTIGGWILDATKKYKETTLIVYVLSLLGMVMFSVCLRLSHLWPLYFFSGFLGFFMTGYLPIGFEFGAEISYPNPEGTSAGMLNAGAQVRIIFARNAS